MMEPIDALTEHDSDRKTEAHGATIANPDAKPILEVEDLKMYFPVKSSGLVRRTVGHVQAVDGISFQVPAPGLSHQAERAG
jgi:ABC-type microcin C transport system duplicated ATPase subunit YejF